MRHAALLITMFSIVACRSAGDEPSPAAIPAGPAAEPVWPEPQPVSLGGTSTDGVVARKNLDAQIKGYEQALTFADRLALRAALVDALLTRTSFFGTYADFDRAFEVADGALARWPQKPEATVLKARVLSAVHRFAEAEALLATVADHQAAATAADVVDLALGRNLDGVLQRRQTYAEKYPSWHAYADLAAAQAARGELEAADASYRKAMEVYRDVSPMAHAWVAFQRGVMWAEVAGDAPRAVPLYREAVRRLPGYVVATVHLAELEAEHDLTGALARLRGLLGKTGDPEPAGLLGELLLHSEPATAAAHVADAEATYESLLSKHRAAFLDHGSEFFAGPGGDPARGLTLAQENLAIRPTERAYLVAIEAALAAGEKTLACDLAGKAPATPISAPLTEAKTAACK